MAYTVQLRLGDFAAELEEGDLPEDMGTVLVLDKLTMGWRYAGDDVPAALEPLTAHLQLATRDVTGMVSIKAGDLAYVRCIDGNGITFASVYGRVAELVATQTYRRIGDGSLELWTVFDVDVVDHTATSDVPVTTTLPPEDNVWYDRLIALGDAAGIPVGLPYSSDLQMVRLPGPMKTFELDAAGLVSTLRDYLRHLVNGEWSNSPLFLTDLDFIYRVETWFVLAPIADPDTGELVILDLQASTDPVAPDDLPAALTIRDGLLTLALLVDQSNAAPGHLVNLSGTWRRGMDAQVNTITLRGDRTVTRSTAPSGGPVVRRELECDFAALTDELDNTADWQALADAYLATPSPSGWTRESFVYNPESVDDLGTSWFPDWTTDHYSPEVLATDLAAPCFRIPVAVGGIKPEGQLAGAGGVYGGLLRSVDLTLERARVTVEFTLHRHAPHLADEGEDLVTWEWLREEFPSTSIRGAGPTVDPNLSYTDLRLARRS